MAPSAVAVETVTTDSPTYTPAGEYRGPSKVQFDPKIHLNYIPPKRSYTYSDLGIPAKGTSDLATTEPFQLATDAAVLELRRELLQPNTLKRRIHWWPRSPACLRGFTKEEAPFTHAFWTSPEVIKIMSDLATIDLEVSLPYEIGHTNVQLGYGGRGALKDLSLEPVPVPAGWEEKEGEYDNVPVDNWHTDSFPYSCVMMLSNTSKMIGGETALQLPDGTVKKLRGTTLGSAILIQGRHIRHAALRATGTGERITQVCPYRAAHPMLRDETEITNSLQLSYLNELYGQFALERFRVLKRKSEYMIETLEKAKKEALEREPENYNAVFMDRDETKKMMKEMIWYLQVGIGQLGFDKENGEKIGE
ncbi:uncharacterized protein Z518_00885 [Rhinocladiella mackenziei CBS 650.93]|uniref:Fe2OG dioxygenase domain-containing protein n=1 Tax=Rhinocladiella mackenziei CBS 650.93 TaxID=1442369 RepID=A0A0D2IUM9_9EURO|nr:uncharacterized protein Z518_00885 [Rhinocladiella mackenziei CBS 650.93]KIX09804.1 hypothetical protein Z518_00885 [Rhinocladiella mackenziei CBS 650.93]